MTVILVAVNSVLLVIQVSEKDKEGTNGLKKKKSKIIELQKQINSRMLILPK